MILYRVRIWQNSHGFCHLDLIESFELYFQNASHSVLRRRPQMSVCHIVPCINVLVFASGIWIYKVSHNPKISWEVPRFQNKESKTLQKLQNSIKRGLKFYKIKMDTFFLEGKGFDSALTDSIFSPHPPPGTHSMLNSPQWRWKKLSEGKKSTLGVALSAVMVVQC